VCRTPGTQNVDVLLRVHSPDLLVTRSRCLAMHQEIIKTLRAQLVFDCTKACRLLRVSCRHLVMATGRM
jgi:hypothetical protein